MGDNAETSELSFVCSDAERTVVYFGFQLFKECLIEVDSYSVEDVFYLGFHLKNGAVCFGDCPIFVVAFSADPQGDVRCFGISGEDFFLIFSLIGTEKVTVSEFVKSQV